MAENVTPVVLEIKDFEPREVMMVDYKFDQATDREGQIAGIPEPEGLLREVCEYRRRCSHEGVERHQLLLHQLRREVGGRPAALRGD